MNGGILKKFFAILCAIFSIFCGVDTYADNNCTGATYYDSDSDTCIACPAGYDANTTAGKTDITQCQMHCDAGTWCGEYTELEYITIDEAAYIDTGLKMGIDITVGRGRLYVDASLLNITNSSGEKVIAGGSNFWVGKDNNWCIGYGANAFDVCTSAAPSSNRCIYDLDLVNGKYTVYDTENENYLLDISISSGSKVNSSHKISIGGYNGATSASNVRIYLVSIYNSGIPIFRGIPVRRNSDNAIGLYDYISGTFKTNGNASGTITAGPDTSGAFCNQCTGVGMGYYAPAQTVNYGSNGTRTACPAGTTTSTTTASSINDCASCAGATYLNSDTKACDACPVGYDYNTTPGKTDITQCQKHCAAGTWGGEYTELEYIESSGTQYIDTGYMFTDNRAAKVVIDTAFMSDGSTWRGHGINNGALGGPWVGISTSNKHGAGTSDGIFQSSNTATIGTRYLYTFDVTSGTFSVKDVVNDAVVHTETGITTSYVPGTRTYKLFGYANGNDINHTAKHASRVYSLKLYENDILVRDMIPVRRNSDGAVGMYDKVTNTFFANAGTGTFSAGSDGESSGLCVDVGMGYYAAAQTVNYGSNGTRTACPAGTTTVGYGHGADEANDCGRELHIGNSVIYMRRNKPTTPALNISMANGDIYYIGLSTTDHNISRLHFQQGQTKYTAYDDSLLYDERDFDTEQPIAQ